MSFIGESRNTINSPWRLYVCLDIEDCEMLMEAVGKVVARKLSTLEYYRGIHEAGEATEKQQTKLMEAEKSFDAIVNIRNDMVKYIKLKKGV